MQDLWGNEIPLQNSGTTKGKTTTHIVPLTLQDCYFYGHTWTKAGMNGEKLCTVCGIKGYCPGCTSVAPQDTQPFFCTRHSKGRVQA